MIKDIPKYGVYWKDYLLINNFYNTIRVKYYHNILEKEGVEYLIWIDPSNRIVNFEFDPTQSFPQNELIIKLSNKEIFLEEGNYNLYSIFYLNETPFIISRIVWENFINIFYIDETLLPEDCIRKISSKKNINGKIVGDDTYYILLRGGYIPIKDIKTGKNYSRLREDDLIKFFCTSELLYPLSNTINKANYHSVMFNHVSNNNLKSTDTTIFGKDEQKIFLDGIHYSHQFISTLQEAYKEIKFFTTPSDWGKDVSWKTWSEENQKEYKEWVRYTIGFEDYSNSRREFFPNVGPVILYVTLPIEFEYATTDTELFRERRHDLFLDQFITYYANDSVNLGIDILGDNSKAVGFSIVWNKDEMLNISDQIQRRNSGILDNIDMSVHSMKFSCNLHFHVIRSKVIISPILEGVLKLSSDDPIHNKDQDYITNIKATEKQKTYILEKYAKGEFIKDGELDNLEKGIEELPQNPIVDERPEDSEDYFPVPLDK